MARKTVFVAASAAFSALAMAGLATVMHDTHAHMERVRGHTYMDHPFMTRLSHNLPASLERVGAKLFGNDERDRAILASATYKVPCPAPVFGGK